MADVSMTVVGAGAVGLAVAARLVRRHPDLVILERRERPGQETSSRNSEVVHAGLYYPPGTLKALLCVEGNRRIYELADQHGVPCRRITKIIVAIAEAEVAHLEKLLKQGEANGVRLQMLTGAECLALEPNVPAVAGLLSPDTGIVSAHGLMDFFLHEARSAGATVQLCTELITLDRHDAGYELMVKTGPTIESFTSERVVNAAGLESDTVASLAGIDLDAAGYRLHYWKGSYFAVASAKAKLLSRLVYPVPNALSLGTHAVLGLDGRVRFGPDAEHVPDRALDYRVDESKRAAFGESVRRLVPAITDDDLAPDLAGIRAKLQGPGEGFRDFVVAEESARGLPGLVNLIGIDSPGLTSAPAIADRVAELLGE
jgi:L-2-hydroxyglutarate oxidase LhgO